MRMVWLHRLADIYEPHLAFMPEHIVGTQVSMDEVADFIQSFHHLQESRPSLILMRGYNKPANPHMTSYRIIPSQEDTP